MCVLFLELDWVKQSLVSCIQLLLWYATVCKARMTQLVIQGTKIHHVATSSCCGLHLSKVRMTQLAVHGTIMQPLATSSCCSLHRHSQPSHRLVFGAGLVQTEPCKLHLIAVVVCNSKTRMTQLALLVTVINHVAII